ncbi:MAG: hypothetical protein KDA28_17120, partial [Phycisphaerales bacterium]|nr:hypothetical protein [Phycisphaerales bacterium]
EPLGTMRGGGPGELTVHQATDIAVSVGPFEFVEPVLVVLPEETGLGDRGDQPIEGILGATLIKRHLITVDYGSGTLTIARPESYEMPEKATVIPIRLAHDFPYFEGEVVPSLMGKPGTPVRGNYLLDLGANHGVLLDHGPAQEAGLLDVDDPDQKTWGIGAGVDGTPRTFMSTPAVSITMGGVAFQDERLQFETAPGFGPPIENLVGNVGGASFRGKVVTLDYANRRIIVSESPKASSDATSPEVGAPTPE